MSIWLYAEAQREIEQVRLALRASDCIYCNAMLTTPRDDRSHGLTNEYEYPRGPQPFSLQQIVRCCPVCGWWFFREERVAGHPYRHIRVRGASGVLRNLDLSDQTVPLAEIRAYLAARYEDRFQINPARFEDVVGSVYRDLGYQVQATGRTGDGGIDAVLSGPGGTVGVQVKRYKGKILADQIREFAGALYLKGLLSGIYVTTSGFTRGAQQTAAEAARVSLPIELVDSSRFFAQLGLAQRRAYETLSDRTAPYNGANLQLVHETVTR